MVNQKTNGAVYRAAYWAVNGALDRAVLGAVSWDVKDAMYEAVSGAVIWAVVDATIADPDHPGLRDFLLVVRESR